MLKSIKVCAAQVCDAAHSAVDFIYSLDMHYVRRMAQTRADMAATHHQPTRDSYKLYLQNAKKERPFRRFNRSFGRISHRSFG